MFKNLARGLSAAMPAAVAATPLANLHRCFELAKAGGGRWNRAQVVS